MKSFVINLIIILLSFNFYAQTPIWEEVHDISSSGFSKSIRDINFSSVNTGYMIGDKTNMSTYEKSIFMLKTIDGGNTWSLLWEDNSTNPVSGQKIIFSDDNHGIIINYYNQPDKSKVVFYKTSDGGITWSINEISGLGHGIDFIYKNDIIYLYGHKEPIDINNRIDYLLESDDFFSTWNTNIFSVNNRYENVYFINNQIGFARTLNDKIYKTINGGDNWVEIGSLSTSVMSETPGGFFFSDNEQTGVISGQYSPIFQRSTDAGVTWQAVTIGSNNNPESSDLIRYNNAIYSINSSNGPVYRSLDFGATWVVLPPPYAMQNLYLFDEYTGIAVKDHKIYKMNTNALAAATTDLQDKIMVYPSPTTDTLHITTKDITIDNFTFYTLTGKQEDISVNKENGHYLIDISKLASGTYILQLNTNTNQLLTKKIIKK